MVELENFLVLIKYKMIHLKIVLIFFLRSLCPFIYEKNVHSLKTPFLQKIL
jgi:hypothetical protein